MWKTYKYTYMTQARFPSLVGLRLRAFGAKPPSEKTNVGGSFPFQGKENCCRISIWMFQKWTKRTTYLFSHTQYPIFSIVPQECKYSWDTIFLWMEMSLPIRAWLSQCHSVVNYSPISHQDALKQIVAKFGKLGGQENEETVCFSQYYRTALLYVFGNMYV